MMNVDESASVLYEENLARAGLTAEQVDPVCVYCTVDMVYQLCFYIHTNTHMHQPLYTTILPHTHAFQPPTHALHIPTSPPIHLPTSPPIHLPTHPHPYTPIHPSTPHQDSTVMHALNGYLFCNAPPLQLTMGATSRWLLAALGSESDLHTPMFVQQQLLEEGRAVSTVELLPSITKVVTVQATTKGLWEVHCNVAHHYEQGMRMGLQVV